MALEKKGIAEQLPYNPYSNCLGYTRRHFFAVRADLRSSWPEPGAEMPASSAKQDRPKVPDSLNCRLWLYSLHPETTVEDLLGKNGAIQTGAVYALNLVPSRDLLPHERIKTKYNQHGQERYLHLDPCCIQGKESVRQVRLVSAARRMTTRRPSDLLKTKISAHECFLIPSDRESHGEWARDTSETRSKILQRMGAEWRRKPRCGIWGQTFC